MKRLLLIVLGAFMIISCASRMRNHLFDKVVMPEYTKAKNQTGDLIVYSAKPDAQGGDESYIFSRPVEPDPKKELEYLAKFESELLTTIREETHLSPVKFVFLENDSTTKKDKFWFPKNIEFTSISPRSTEFDEIANYDYALIIDEIIIRGYVLDSYDANTGTAWTSASESLTIRYVLWNCKENEEIAYGFPAFIIEKSNYTLGKDIAKELTHDVVRYIFEKTPFIKEN
jgi:hypothetical protein